MKSFEKCPLFQKIAPLKLNFKKHDFLFFDVRPPQGTQGPLRVKIKILNLDNFSKIIIPFIIKFYDIWGSIAGGF